MLLFIVAIPFYSPTNCGQGFQFFHILANIVIFCFFKIFLFIFILMYFIYFITFFADLAKISIILIDLPKK